MIAGMDVRFSESNPEWLSGLAERFSKEFKKICVVGYPVGGIGQGAGQPYYEDGTSLAQVAEAMNDGTSRAPARPFFDRSIPKMQNYFLNLLEEMQEQIVTGAVEYKKILDLTGLECAKIIRKTLMDGPWRPNSPQTIRRKGSSRPLMDTGALRQGATYAIRNWSSG